MHDAQTLQAPIRNASVIGAQVYSHSGEFSPRVTDITIPGRFFSFQFVRKYRSSRSQEVGPVGRGWTFGYSQHIARDGDAIVYCDGLGRFHQFPWDGRAYNSPDGIYALLTRDKETFAVRARYGTVYMFETPEAGGRLKLIENENGNKLQFKRDGALVVTEPLGREIVIVFDHDRVVEVRDHANRLWRYVYDHNDCLVEVVRPITEEFRKGTRIQYGYDNAFRLNSVTDPNGQMFLLNDYDLQGRVIRQKHGTGYFEFHYVDIERTKGAVLAYRTEVRQKNGASLILDHNSPGHVTKRTLFVSKDATTLAVRGPKAEGFVPLITQSKFNRHGELIERIFPAGDRTTLTYEEDNADPRSRGNLLRVARYAAAGMETDHEHLETRFSYDHRFNRRTAITNPRGHTIKFKWDDRGNLIEKIYPTVTIQKVSADSKKVRVRKAQLVERFAYNPAGQVIRVTDACGAVTRYFYYPESDPSGARGHKGIHSDSKRSGGYLARVVRDVNSKDRRLRAEPANLTTELGYDWCGNVTTVWDGKKNATRFFYDAQSRLLRLVSRGPANHEVLIRRDANGNLLDAKTSFRYQHYDPGTHKIAAQSSTVTHHFQYDVLNQIVRRSVVAGGREIVESFARDTNENIVRKIQPLGNVSEFRFDERNLLVERHLGVGSKDHIVIRYTYTPNGRRSSVIDGRGGVIRYDYDGFHRYRGFSNALGTNKRQSFDEVDNIIRIEIAGDQGLGDEDGNPRDPKSVKLLETNYAYDELNRRVQINRAWRDLLTERPLGQSRWAGNEGVVSTVVEYSDNHRPAKIWYETGNVLQFQYDGANRVVAAADITGESVGVKYDKNGNAVRIERVGPNVEGEPKRFSQVINQEFDELDRLVVRSANSGLPESFAYHGAGPLKEYRNPAGQRTLYLHDAFGRRQGQAAVVAVLRAGKRDSGGHLLLHRVETNENGLVVARTNASDQITRYTYDALNRRAAVIYPDGATKHFERDATGNVERIVDQNRNVILHRFDALNRLVERQVETVGGKGVQLERFHYDGLNRLTSAVTEGARTIRRYDTLSRLLEESQGGRIIHYGYDSAGNRTNIAYPGGLKILKVYNPLKQVSEVHDGADGPVARFAYRCSSQLSRQQVGNILEAHFSYTAQGRLEEIKYYSKKGGRLCEGSAYKYDAVGNRMSEAQLQHGSLFGETYRYDSVNRLIAVRYGVRDVKNSKSKFAEQVDYEVGPEGTWRRKVVRESDGQIRMLQRGFTNDRQGYSIRGDHPLEYDANGNRVFEAGRNGNWVTKRLTYDYANRPICVEFLNAAGRSARTIQYTYDVFGRQTRKNVSGEGRDYESVRVWNGRQLIEEWENGNLARSFVYGPRAGWPVQMIRYTASGLERYAYTFNGRGLVTGLVDVMGDFNERYRYDVFRQPFVGEQKDQTVVERVSFSKIGNPLFFGTSIWDAESSAFQTLGSSFDPAVGQFTNPESMPGEPGCGNDYSAGPNPPSRPGQGGDPRVAGDIGDDIYHGGSLVGGGTGLAVVGFKTVVEAASLAGILGGIGAIAVGGLILGIGLGFFAVAMMKSGGGPCSAGGGSQDRQSMSDEDGGMGGDGGGMMGGGMGGDGGGMMGGGMGGEGGMMGGGMGGEGGMMGGGMGSEGGMMGGGMGEGGMPGGQDPGSGGGGEGGSGGMGGSCGGGDGGGGMGGDGGGGMGGGSADYTSGDDSGGSGHGAAVGLGRPPSGITQPGGDGFGTGYPNGPTSPSDDGCSGDPASGSDDPLGEMPGTSGGGCGGSTIGPMPETDGCGIAATGLRTPIIGGTNPTALAGGGFAGGNPTPIDNWGAMGAPAGMGLTGMPGGGLTDPAGEDVGMGQGFAGSYPPVQPGQPYTDPSPEQGAGTCGKATRGGIGAGDCSPF